MGYVVLLFDLVYEGENYCINVSAVSPYSHSLLRARDIVNRGLFPTFHKRLF